VSITACVNEGDKSRQPCILSQDPLLLASGFQLHRSGEGRNLLHSFQQFIVEQSHEGYFDGYSVNKKKHMWAGLGLTKKKAVLLNLK
jgi:hypothetical protein